MTENSRKLVVFDLDGTLVDTLPDIASAGNLVLENHGYPVHPVGEYAAFVGSGLSRTLRSALEHAGGLSGKYSVSETLFESMFAEMLDHYTRSPARRSAVYPGMDTLADDLKSRGTALGVFTNKNEPIAAALIDALFPPRFFDFLIGGGSGVPLKPDPAALLDILKCGGRIRIDEIGESSILMIGDSEVDAETARRAGIAFAGVSWGYRDEAVLRAAGASVIFQSPGALHRWIVNQWR